MADTEGQREVPFRPGCIPFWVRRIGWPCALAVMLSLLTVTAVAGAPRRAYLVSPNVKISARSYADWEARWWQWRLRLPGRHAAANDHLCASAGQAGPVWFLGGNNGRPLTVTRKCHVTRGRYLLIGAPSIDCSTVEPAPFYAASDSGLLACALYDWVHARPRARLRVDGVAVNPAGFTTAALPFDFVMPATDNYLGISGPTRGRAAVYGFAALLHPLTKGKHTVVASFNYSGALPQTATYDLTVG